MTVASTSGRRVRRLCVLSMHTSPLAQPGSADAGGMNVYVRELATSLAQAGGVVRRDERWPGVWRCRWRSAFTPWGG